MPRVSGVIVKPELVADSPTTFTMKRGRKTMALRNTAPLMKAAALPTANVLLRKSFRSSRGSSTVRSARMKAMSPTAESANMPRICGEPHA